MSTHDVSVVTRTYDSADTIERAIDSLVDQTLDSERYEVVVVDDGSKDGTKEIVAGYADTHPSLIRFFPTEHAGPVPTLNDGIERTRGRYVTVLDADDYFLPTFLERTVSALDDRPAVDFAYADYHEESVDGERTYVDTADDLFSTITVGITFRREALFAVGCYDESVVFSEYDLLAKLRRDGRTGYHIDEPLFVYDRRDDSLTADRERVERGKRQLRERYGEDFEVRDY